MSYFFLESNASCEYLTTSSNAYNISLDNDTPYLFMSYLNHVIELSIGLYDCSALWSLLVPLYAKVAYSNPLLLEASVPTIYYVPKESPLLSIMSIPIKTVYAAGSW